MTEQKRKMLIDAAILLIMLGYEVREIAETPHISETAVKELKSDLDITRF